MASKRSWPAKIYYFSVQSSLLAQKLPVFFSWATGKDFFRDTSQVIEIVRATVKRMPHRFTDDNLVTTLCSVYIKLHRLNAYLLIDIES